MYLPKNFREEDRAALYKLMREHNFATLITPQRGSTLPQISHLPFLLDTTRGEYGVLQAHVARGNPQWQEFVADQEVMVIFQGAHSYISPSWYEANELNVPTWNYTVVHAYGKPHIVEDDARVYQILQELVQQHEHGFETPWSFEVSEEQLSGRLHGIVAFEIEITRLEGKFKLSQNRRLSDRLRVIEALQAGEDASSLAVASLMQKALAKE